VSTFTRASLAAALQAVASVELHGDAVSVITIQGCSITGASVHVADLGPLLTPGRCYTRCVVGDRVHRRLVLDGVVWHDCQTVETPTTVEVVS